MNQKPNQSSLDSSEISLPAFDADTLLAKAGIILQREIGNLMRASLAGKLDRSESQDLVAYVKLLTEIKSEMQDALANMSDAELQKAAKS